MMNINDDIHHHKDQMVSPPANNSFWYADTVFPSTSPALDIPPICSDVHYGNMGLDVEPEPSILQKLRNIHISSSVASSSFNHQNRCNNSQEAGHHHHTYLQSEDLSCCDIDSFLLNNGSSRGGLHQDSNDFSRGSHEVVEQELLSSSECHRFASTIQWISNSGDHNSSENIESGCI